MSATYARDDATRRRTQEHNWPAGSRRRARHATKGGPRMFERILAAIDGSDRSGRAIEMAGELAKLSKGEVRVVHVHEYSLGVGGPLIDEPRRRPTTWCSMLSNHWQTRASQSPGPYVRHTLVGSPPNPRRGGGLELLGRHCGISTSHRLAWPFRRLGYSQAHPPLAPAGRRRSLTGPGSPAWWEALRWLHS
jgi:Universal stress protein family